MCLAANVRAIATASRCDEFVLQRYILYLCERLVETESDIEQKLRALP